MAEDSGDDDQEKSEEPTERKLDKAKKEGQTVFSKEIVSLLLMIAISASFLLVIPWSSKGLLKKLIPFIDHPHDFIIDSSFSATMFWDLYKISLLFLLPTFGTVLFFILSGGLYQKWGAFSLKSIKPKFGNLSLKKGFKKIFSAQNLVDNIKNWVKLTTLISLLYWVLVSERHNIRKWLWITSPVFFKTLLDLIFIIFLTLIISFGAVAVFDYLYQYFQFMKKMKMTKYDIKQEHKESEGNPEVKAKLRQLRMSKAQERMMADVPRATVVLANPTHYAIALLWDNDSMAAPVVVAKGQDDVAQRIKAVAKENNVPVIENPSLTRALYSEVDLKDEIPPKFYKAIAEVIRIVMRIKNQYF